MIHQQGGYAPGWQATKIDLVGHIVDEEAADVDAAGGVEMRLVGSSESIGTQISRFDLTLYGSIATEGDD